MQGGQVFDNVVCGGGDSGAGISSTAVPLISAAQAAVKAVILMGDPRYVGKLILHCIRHKLTYSPFCIQVYRFSYEVGSCRAGGLDVSEAGRENVAI